jgi:hypothetical protein
VQLDFYTRFKIEHPKVYVGFIAFKKLKPYFVRKSWDFNSCCCKYHEEMLEIKVGFNNMWVMQVHVGSSNQPCSCGFYNVCLNPSKGCVLGTKVICWAHHHVYRRISKLWGLFLCPKTKLDDPFHKLECVRSECPSCGFHRLLICDKELDTSNDSVVEWHRFEKEDKD